MRRASRPPVSPYRKTAALRSAGGGPLRASYERDRAGPEGAKRDLGCRSGTGLGADALILDLQRAAGNQAVVGLLSGRGMGVRQLQRLLLIGEGRLSANFIENKKADIQK